MMLVTITPISILLSTIYSVGKCLNPTSLFQSNVRGKVILMLSPVLVICAYLSLLSLSLNYQWAPESEAQKKQSYHHSKMVRSMLKTKNTKLIQDSLKTNQL